MYIYLQNFHSPIRSPHTTTPRQRSARFSRATILRSTRGANHSLSHTPRLITLITLSARRAASSST